MLQEIPDIDATKHIVRMGIIPAIQNEIDKDDVYQVSKVRSIKKLIDAYFDFMPEDNITMKDFYTHPLIWRKYSEEQEKKDAQEDKTMVVEEDSCD